MYFDNKAITFFGVAFQQLYLYIPFVTLLVNYVSILLPQCTTLYLIFIMNFIKEESSFATVANNTCLDEGLTVVASLYGYSCQTFLPEGQAV